MVRLLPFMEQKPLYDQIASPQTYNGINYPAFNVRPMDTNYEPWGASIPTLLCPSDPEANGAGELGRCSYHFSNGDYAGWWGMHRTRGPFGVGVLYPSWENWYRGGVIGFSDIRDGTSNTLAMSERGIPGGGNPRSIKTAVAINQTAAINYANLPEWTSSSPIVCMSLRGESGRYAEGVATANWTEGSFSFGWQGRNAEISTILPPNGPSCAVAAHDFGAVIFTPTSYHPGGVNTVFLDGSVRFISDQIDTGDLSQPWVHSGPSPYGVWGALGSKGGGEVASY